MKCFCLCRFLFLLGLFFGSTLQLLGGEEVLREPFPDWADELTPDFSETTAEEEAEAAGTLMLLYDRQIRVEDATELVHRATRLLNQSGVDQYSRIMLEFEPSYQTVTLHRLRIHRDGEVIDFTDRQEIQVRERESNLESNLYYGMLSAEVLLQDTRPGDVLEWAYSISGDNPIFEGKFSDSYGLAAFNRMRQYRIRFLLPEEGAEEYEFHKSDNVPDEVVTRNGSEIVVKTYNTNGFENYPDAPSWFHPYPWVAVNAYASWEEVVNWALPLYAEADHLPVEMEKIRDAILSSPGTEEDRVQKALRYVQDTLRYISLSSGLHSHKPYPISDVLQRRYGDCKDNALMLVALLRSMEIDAWPALVDSGLEHTIEDYYPSPNLFDHVVVRVDLASGKSVWLDPTDSYQRGPLHQIFTAEYGKALLLQPGATKLVDMPGNGLEATKIEVEEKFTLPVIPGAHTLLEVKTVYYGPEADYMRYTLAGNSLTTLQDDYGDYYSRHYGEVSPKGELQVEDNEQENILTVEEAWILKDPWKPETDEDYPLLEFQPFFIDQLGNIPDSLRQQRPYDLSYPKKVDHTITVELPFPLPFLAESFEKDTPHFYFGFEDEIKDRTIRISYRYESRADYVPADELATYKNDMQEAGDYSAYTIVHPWRFMEDRELESDSEETVEEEEKFVPHLGLLALMNASFLLGIFIMVLLCRKAPSPEVPALLKYNEVLVGVKGWLILPVLGLVLTMIKTLNNFLSDGYWSMDADVWEALTTVGGDGYHPLWKPVILFSIFSIGFVLGYIPVLFINVFRRKAGVPRAFIFHFLVLLFVMSVDVWTGTLLGDALTDELMLESRTALIRVVIFMPIWIGYFLKSVRVKVTFTR